MASNERKRTLDQSTRAALSGMDSLLAELAEDGLRPGEFTARQAYESHREKGGARSDRSIREILVAKARNGQMLCRKAVIDGKWTNAYRAP